MHRPGPGLPTFDYPYGLGPTMAPNGIGVNDLEPSMASNHLILYALGPSMAPNHKIHRARGHGPELHEFMGTSSLSINGFPLEPNGFS